MRPIHLFAALVMALVFGLGWVLAKDALDRFPPILLAGFRFVVTAMALIGLAPPPRGHAGRASRAAQGTGIAAPLIFLWGVASFTIVAPLQMRIVAEAAEAPNLASAMNIGAFNLGNAIGAALGGGVIDAGLGLPAVSVAGAIAASSGLALLFAMKRGRKPAEAPVAAGC